MLGNLLVNVYGITVRIDIGTELGSLDGSFHVSNDVNVVVLLHG